MSLIPARMSNRLLAAALLVVSGAAPARPPDEPADNLLNDSFTLQTALSVTSNSTQLRYDSITGRTGTVIDAEQQAGLPSRKLVNRADMVLRIRNRHRIRLTDYYLPLDRRGTAVLRAPVDFGSPPPFAAGRTIDTTLTIHQLALTYSYALLKTQQAEIGATLGIDLIGVEASIASRAPVRIVREEGSSPTPLLGIDSTVRLSPRLYVESRAQFIRGNVRHVQGRITAYEANLLYRLTPNVTFGLGYSDLHASIDSHQFGNNGRVALITRGPQLLVRVGF